MYSKAHINGGKFLLFCDIKVMVNGYVNVMKFPVPIHSNANSGIQ